MELYRKSGNMATVALKTKQNFSTTAETLTTEEKKKRTHT
jgi:hypothetical protein